MTPAKGGTPYANLPLVESRWLICTSCCLAKQRG